MKGLKKDVAFVLIPLDGKHMVEHLQGNWPDKGNNLCFDIAAIVAQSPRDSNYPLNILPSPNAIAVAAVA